MASSIGGNFSSMGMMHRPDPTQMASRLFSKLDTKNQGYIERSDLQSALSQVAGNGSSDAGASVDDVFSQFDGDSDGKITKDEMSSGFQKLAEALDSQFGQMRMKGFGGHGGHHGMQGADGMPPPPPPQGGQEADDAGFTKDELTSQLEEMGSSDSRRSDLIGSIVDNFDKADSDGDGKVTRKEAMAFHKAGSASGTDATAGTAATSESSEAKVMHRIMQLMHAYGSRNEDSGQSAAASLLAVAA